MLSSLLYPIVHQIKQNGKVTRIMNSNKYDVFRNYKKGNEENVNCLFDEYYLEMSNECFVNDTFINSLINLKHYTSS